MVMGELRQFSLENYLSRGVACDDDYPVIDLKPMRSSTFIRLPQGFLSPVSDPCLRLGSWNVHITSSYQDILQLIDDFSSKFSSSWCL